MHTLLPVILLFLATLLEHSFWNGEQSFRCIPLDVGSWLKSGTFNGIFSLGNNQKSHGTKRGKQWVWRTTEMCESLNQMRRIGKCVITMELLLSKLLTKYDAISLFKVFCLLRTLKSDERSLHIFTRWPTASNGRFLRAGKNSQMLINVPSLPASKKLSRASIVDEGEKKGFDSFWTPVVYPKKLFNFQNVVIAKT